MKNMLMLFLFLCSLTSLACADLKTKPAWMSHKKIECGTLLNKISDPMMTVNGRTLPFAMDEGDMSGKCPVDGLGCYQPYYNMKARGNAICKAYGMGHYAKFKSYSFKNSRQMITLQKNASGLYSPKIIKVDPAGNDYHLWVKTIYCHKKYKKS